ncbi:MAG: hypothetical protein JWN73_1918 [Betaproteobacteria bacterium]|nr:hypothetical protein [Betaproteobacteria bacterium]
MRPGSSALAYALAWLLLGIAASLWPPALLPWQIAGGVFGVALVADWMLARRPLDLTLERCVPASWPVGVPKDVMLRLANHSGRGLRLALYDHHPQAGIAELLPLSLALPNERSAQIAYRYTPIHRGDLTFGQCDVRVASPMRLWERKIALGETQTVRVFPNFAAISGYALLATDNRLSQIGVLQRRRRGEGMDFHQLREYREGDSQRQVDWNATSRMRKLISREYRDERDQHIVFLIDCGRRMSATDLSATHLTHFDHVLNAALLLGYVSLRQGDAVGYLTFATETPRFAAPRKSGAAVSVLLNGLYDVQPSLDVPDYTQAAVNLSARLKRRALVIVLSNLRDEDDETLAPALRLLTGRHLVLFASLREPTLDEKLREPVRDLDTAVTHVAAVDYAFERQRALKRIERSGAMVLDVEPQKLPIALVNRYLDIKRAGRL